MLFGRPQALLRDVRVEREGAITDDAFDLCLEYPGNMRAHLSVSMLSISPRPRFLILGTRGGFVKKAFDPLENALRNSEVPTADAWMMEREENWGEVTLMENGETVRRRVPSRGRLA